MLAKRIIPCLDVKEGRVVKGKQFVQLRDAGDPVELAMYYNSEGADELVFLDISASSEGRNTMVEVVREVAAKLNIPFTVGGGIQSLDNIKTLLRAGADKISLNSSAIANPDLITAGADFFGCQCIVCAIDAKWNPETGTYQVYTHGGQRATSWDAIEWAKRAVALGAGEILLTSMDQDGEKSGFELNLTRKISEAVDVPVIASGGAGKASDFLDAFQMGKADAALAASIFHYKETSVANVKSFLKQKGVAIR
ncbi:imidazole glycerol phosphate synthase subunit HisF [Sporolactobacillus laevolacticus]|jgi:cyclase|uniref:imidazole glycerol phosphate synthase subunit HisF n=1 Tax=Sporolactobacillus laevolacticus TaxID=33018 RepID=UPI0025B588CE|nr:imidazole glycerol phosphate synthase subunit HisF [Sporolactobacillus laevolacticus]MDF2911727.1 imidazole glycerol phosphate synthase subunit HisF [Sporolactobacillus laevolacticus]MDN3955655.1 imidazole glycerol phosphate synthase subunit HisF [Sporolactobacillus laevolacticus]